MIEDTLFALILPRPGGGWWVEVGDEEHRPGSEALERQHGVKASEAAWTRGGAKRLAKRLLRLHRRAAANLARESFVVR